jgi:hypothetical protein
VLLVLKDAGVQEFTCPEFTVRFPLPAPPVAAAPVVDSRPRVVDLASGAPAAPSERDNYDRLFRGNKPTLKRAE